MKSLNRIAMALLTLTVLSSCSGNVSAGYLLEARWDGPPPEEKPEK